jgi:hypothetical protein
MSVMPPDDIDAAALDATRAWVTQAVIGLNLCPFAKAVQARGQVRYVLSHATTPAALRADLEAEMKRLAATPPEQIDTTLLVHPFVLTDFAAFNDFLDVAEAALERLDLDGVLQIASFHPQYHFAGTDPDDLGNATNQSPFPTLHLLREASVERAVAAFPDAEAIYETNIATLQALGRAGWADLRRRIVAAAPTADAAPTPGNAAPREAATSPAVASGPAARPVPGGGCAPAAHPSPADGPRPADSGHG